MKLFCTQNHGEPTDYLYLPDWTNDELKKELDWVLKSNAAVQVLFDESSVKDYPKLVNNLLKLFKKHLKETK